MKEKDLDQILTQAKQSISTTDDLRDLQTLRVQYLGQKGLITTQLKSLGALDPESRREMGQRLNHAKQSILGILNERQTFLESQALEAELNNHRLDISLPGRHPGVGSLHPLMQVWSELETLFLSMGFDVLTDSPEIEDEYHNFSALNIPKHHPARATQDTFYTHDGRLLRTQTSPMQIRIMETQTPPIRVVTPGRVFRSDAPDQTHSPMFFQLEGLWIDKQVTFSDLKGVLRQFLEAFFGRELNMRFRPSYFPFTEPSAEVDIEFINHQGHQDWLEILGCGMVHPNVLSLSGIDPEQFQGFAFGVGIDRLTMLRHGITDLRLFYDNDLKFLEQFVT